MTLPLETINGKQYQPVEVKSDSRVSKCGYCCFNAIIDCYLSCTDFDGCCIAENRKDLVNVYFIEPEDTNEQE